jgi:hypothetical protein
MININILRGANSNHSFHYSIFLLIITSLLFGFLTSTWLDDLLVFLGLIVFSLALVNFAIQAEWRIHPERKIITVNQ